MPLKKLIRTGVKKLVKKKAARPKPKGVPEGFVQVPKRIANRAQTILRNVEKQKPMTKKQIIDFARSEGILEKAIPRNKKNYISPSNLNKLMNKSDEQYLRKAKRDLEDLGYFSDLFDRKKYDKSGNKIKTKTKPKPKPKNAKEKLKRKLTYPSDMFQDYTFRGKYKDELRVSKTKKAQAANTLAKAKQQYANLKNKKSEKAMLLKNKIKALQAKLK
tara:strand:- start:43 stop:693 length:651 start_codon:yes stop_codon:yes gene_type:complete